jgi:hypothetical protein
MDGQVSELLDWVQGPLLGAGARWMRLELVVRRWRLLCKFKLCRTVSTFC